MSDLGPDRPTQPQIAGSDRKILLALTIALAGWGLYLALGAFFGGFGKGNLPQSALRSVVVLGCVGGFLATWWLLMLGRQSRRSGETGPATRRFQYSLRTLLIVTALIAISVCYVVSTQRMWDESKRKTKEMWDENKLKSQEMWDKTAHDNAIMWDESKRKSQEMWDKTMRENAISSYWTMRTNLESSKRSISPEAYDQLRQTIDQSWKARNPGLEIPDLEPDARADQPEK